MDVDYPKELMESIHSNIRKISIILLAVALLLTFVSFVLINNTMRLSIYARRFSIRTMQLVGAKPSFIRRPFMSNAFWVGFISAMFACALLVFGIDSLVRFDPSMAKVVTWEIVAVTMGTVFGCGIILILLCAYFSVNKYLRMSSIVLGLCLGYGLAFALGKVDMSSLNVEMLMSFNIPQPFKYGVEFNV